MFGNGKAERSSNRLCVGVGLVSLASASARHASRVASSAGGERDMLRSTGKSGETGAGGITGVDHFVRGERARANRRTGAGWTAADDGSDVSSPREVAADSSEMCPDGRLDDESENGLIEVGESGIKDGCPSWSAAQRTIGLCGGSTASPACVRAASSHAGHGASRSSPGVASSGELIANAAARSLYERRPSRASCRSFRSARTLLAVATVDGGSSAPFPLLVAALDSRRAEAMSDDRADRERLSGGAAADVDAECSTRDLALLNEKRRPRAPSPAAAAPSLLDLAEPRSGKCAMRAMKDEVVGEDDRAQSDEAGRVGVERQIGRVGEGLRCSIDCGMAAVGLSEQRKSGIEVSVRGPG